LRSKRRRVVASAPRNDGPAIRFNCQTARGRTSALSRREAPELCVDCHPLKTRGRREAGCTLHPRSRAQLRVAKTHTSIQVQRRHSGFPCAVGYGLYRALPGERAFLSPSPLRGLLLKSLTPASRRQDHTASPSAPLAFVSRKLRVHRIPPRVRDDRDPPLSSGETGGVMPLICPAR
jgi:hypothetical protein